MQYLAKLAKRLSLCGALALALSAAGAALARLAPGHAGAVLFLLLVAALVALGDGPERPA